MLHFDVMATLAIATLILLLGQHIKRQVPVLHRYNLPSPVIGGLLAAIALLLCKSYTTVDITFDNGARTPLMIAFFTTLGFAASLKLLKIGGRFVFIFLAISIFAAILQNVVGASIATLLGLPPLLGVLCGSVTLTGGPATGLAFAPQFEQAGIVGAEAIAVAAAMCGIIMGGVMGGPIGTLLINRLVRQNQPLTSNHHNQSIINTALELLHHHSETALLKSIGMILLAMWMGSWVSAGFQALGITLPAYIGAMLVAATLRNWDDKTGHFKLSETTIENLGAVALSYFLVLSLMGLDLSKLATVALPLLILIAAQVLLIALLSVTLILGLTQRLTNNSCLCNDKSMFFMFNNVIPR